MKNTGRSQFKKYKTLINFFVIFFKIIPNFILQFIWDSTSSFSQLPFILLRYLILNSRIKKCGDNIRIGTRVTIKGWEFLEIGENVSIHDNCFIDASGEIELKNNISIAHNSTLLSTTHTYNDGVPIKYNEIVKQKLIIQDDVWIGCGVRVLNNLEIKHRVIVAAGAVVNKSLDNNAIYGGIPAKKIKTI
ncbi:acyltransferase [uncultured Algibacter sp.]|uniref:acyltransferase n=1 Tax=uncultured Algibacter sp. TaxID=298659 RepID=UPI0032175390